MKCFLNQYYFILIILSILTQTAFSQSQYFYKGYIVDLQNDTISGYVKDNSLRLNTKSLFFKRDSLSDLVREYTPKEIKSYFYVPDNHWFSKNYSESSKKDSLIFVKNILKAKASLYVTSVEDSITAYAIEKEGVLYFLMPPVKSYFKKGHFMLSTYERKSNIFRGKLKFICSDCQKLYPEIDKMQFFEENIINIVTKYNKCVYPKEKIKKRKKFVGRRFYFGPLVGVNYNKINFTLNPVIRRCSYAYETSIIIGANIGYTFFRGLYLDLEMMYSDYKSRAFIERLSNNMEIPISYKAFETNFLLRYEFLKVKLPPNVFVGPKFGYLKSCEFKTDRYYFNDKYDNFIRGIEAGIGIKIPFNNNHSLNFDASYCINKNFRGVNKFLQNNSLQCKAIVKY